MINIRARGEREDSSDLTSLIDVVFILLIFFILAASFAVHSIDFDLPPAKTSKALAGHVVEIRLNKDGSFLCDGIPTKKEELDERFPEYFVLTADPGQHDRLPQQVRQCQPRGDHCSGTGGYTLQYYHFRDLL